MYAETTSNNQTVIPRFLTNDFDLYVYNEADEKDHVVKDFGCGHCGLRMDKPMRVKIANEYFKFCNTTCANAGRRRLIPILMGRTMVRK